MTSIIIAGLALLVCCVQGQLPCRTPKNSTGSCIPIKICSHLLASVSNPRKTEEELKFLKESHCGFDKNDSPKVCCATEIPHECVTLEGNAGICMDIQSCPVLANLLKPPVLTKNKDYVKNHRCDDKNDNHVCCINCQKIVGPPQPRTGCCGIDRSNGKPDPNAIVTAIDQYPWMALIEYENPETKEIRLNCAGNLISSKYILTVAHCTLWNSIRNWIPVRVRLGEYNTSTEGPDCVETDDGQKDCNDGAISIPIDTIIRHHSYKSPYRMHDIALLKLKYDVPYTDFIRPICLPSSDVDEDDTPTFYAAGWGAAGDANEASNVKLQVDLPLVPLEECKASLGNYRFRPTYEGQVCAGGDAGRSTCQGDSGGPLMSYNGFYEIIGIVNFGRGCGIENYPDVFTKVFDYLPWIRNQIKP